MSEESSLWNNLKKLPAYQNSYKLSKRVYAIILKWENFHKYTIGMQLIKSADSVSANIAEGYGRYFYKDKIKFYYYARGSVMEVSDWLSKSKDRNLLSDEDQEELKILINKILKDIHILILNTRKQY